MTVPPDRAPHRIAPAAVLQRWERVAFLHWPVPARRLRPLVPTGLRIDEHEGQAWISLVPFRLAGLRPPRPPSIPAVPSFPETNLRTYVEGSDGPGLWFLSADADLLPFVLALRSCPGIAYHWSSSQVEQTPGGWRYRGRRRGRDVRWDFTVAAGDPIVGPDDRDVFLTARWRAYSNLGPQLLVTRVEHEPWPLRRAAAAGDWSALFSALGLPPPDSPALAHLSPGVQVRLGIPRLARRLPSVTRTA